MKLTLILDDSNEYEKALAESLLKSPGGQIPMAFEGVGFTPRLYRAEIKIQSQDRNIIVATFSDEA